MGAVMQWHGYSHDDRTFHYAIGVSLVLHALLLFAVPGLREGRSVQEPPGVLVARIVEPPRVPVATPPEPVVRPVEPRPLVEPRPKPPPLRKPSPIAEPAPQPTPAPPAAAAEPPPAAPPPPAAVASVPAPGAQAEPQSGPAGNLDLGSLKDYESRLSFFAARYKVYPRVAVDNAWEGNVEVAMVIGANGVLRSVSVRTSSGHDILDRQAMEMFRRAKPLVPIPPSLAGKEFTVTRWVSFGLKEGG